MIPSRTTLRTSAVVVMVWPVASQTNSQSTLKITSSLTACQLWGSNFETSMNSGMAFMIDMNASFPS